MQTTTRWAKPPKRNGAGRWNGAGGGLQGERVEEVGKEEDFILHFILDSLSHFRISNIVPTAGLIDYFYRQDSAPTASSAGPTDKAEDLLLASFIKNIGL